MRRRDVAIWASVALSVTGHVLIVVSIQKNFHKPDQLKGASLSDLPIYRLNSVSATIDATKQPSVNISSTVKRSNVSGIDVSAGHQTTTITEPGLSSVTYLSSEDIHTRSAPMVDWVINRSALSNNTSAAVIFTVWISAEGVIDHFEINDMETQQPWVSAAFANLGQTAMEPATLNELPVASVLTVEVFIDSTTF